MSEKNYETSELKELKDALQTFTEFVWEMEEYLPEFYHFFDTMRQKHMHRLWEYSVMIFKDHIQRQKQELVFILQIF